MVITHYDRGCNHFDKEVEYLPNVSNVINPRVINNMRMVVNESPSKTQAIRLLDVGLFGPLMVLSALNKNPPEYMRLAMLGIGIGTIVYNLYNYIEQEKTSKK